MQGADEQRVAEIERYRVLEDAAPRRDLLALVEVAAEVARVPMATINLITDAQQHQVAAVGFDEIVAGYSDEEARYEAQRCLSCGNCFECDGCFGACPEDAIIKLGKGNRYQYDYDLCTGCGVCYEQCPCHAIEMIAEPAN